MDELNELDEEIVNEQLNGEVQVPSYVPQGQQEAAKPNAVKADGSEEDALKNMMQI